jgi:hypothetical protein
MNVLTCSRKRYRYYNAVKTVPPREYIEWFIEDQAFLRSYDSIPSPPPFSPVSKLSLLFLSLPVCRRSSLLTDEGDGEGVGARSQIIRPRESLGLYKSLNRYSGTTSPSAWIRKTIMVSGSFQYYACVLWSMVSWIFSTTANILYRTDADVRFWLPVSTSNFSFLKLSTCKSGSYYLAFAMTEKFNQCFRFYTSFIRSNPRIRFRNFLRKQSQERILKKVTV